MRRIDADDQGMFDRAAARLREQAAAARGPTVPAERPRPAMIDYVDAMDVLRIRIETGADLRTIWKRVRGEPVRGMVATRVDRALSRMLSERQRQEAAE